MSQTCPVPQPLIPFFFGLPIPYKHMIALSIAITLDVIDFLIIGLIPPLSFIIDILGILALTPFAGAPVLISVAEVIPLLEIFPIFTFSVILSAYLEKRCQPQIPTLAKPTPAR